MVEWWGGGRGSGGHLIEVIVVCVGHMIAAVVAVVVNLVSLDCVLI